MKTGKQHNRKTNEGAVTTASEDAGMYVKLNVGDIKAKFVVNTGATLTLVSSKLYDMLTPLDKSYLCEVKTTVRSECGNKLELRGKGRFNLHFGPNMLQSEAVVTDLQVDGILGLDFMKGHNCLIDVKNGHFCIGDFKQKVKKIPADNALLEANDHAGNDYVLTARTLVRSGEKVPVRLLNTELDPKTIYPGTTIAQMSGVDQVLDGNISSNEQKHDGLRPDLQDLNADALSRIPCKQCGYHTGLEKETITTETEDQHDTVNAITHIDGSNNKDDYSEHHDLSLKEIQKNDHDLKIVTEWVEKDECPEYKDISDKGFF
ncbi:unnamed protein product [Mytilus edulis]|uniref:Peptidase A2 domain-containing protein n=1 Tax=Mytilus edulis TaxID=6550 RepID=A0A8S3R8F4_MYTED|nr:unnamed protein product [Mytilus edulis]